MSSVGELAEPNTRHETQDVCPLRTGPNGPEASRQTAGRFYPKDQCFFCRSQMGFIYNHQHNHTCLPFRSCIIYIESTGPGHCFHGEKSPVSAQLRGRRKSSRHFSDASSKSIYDTCGWRCTSSVQKAWLTPVRRGASSVLSGHHEPLCTRLLPLKRPQQEICFDLVKSEPGREAKLPAEPFGLTKRLLWRCYLHPNKQKLQKEPCGQAAFLPKGLSPLGRFGQEDKPNRIAVRLGWASPVEPPKVR